MNPLLTIGIPTYNRKDELIKNLDLICPQLNDNVNLVVIDNASTSYDFDECISTYVKKYGIVAKRNNVNIGGDANIARLFEDCKTEWLWVLGDDDFVQPYAVRNVLLAISNNNNSIFIKFNSPHDANYKGIEGFSLAMQARGDFGNSFFISEGIHNVLKTRNMMVWHYKYLSTYIAHILRVMKYLCLHKDAEITLSTQSILEVHGMEISWSPIQLVEPQSLVFGYFSSEKQLLNKTVFRDIHSYCLHYIFESKLPYYQKIKLAYVISIKYGIWNSLRYNSKLIIVLIYRLLTGYKPPYETKSN